jgi:hypothetical protein
MRVTRDPLAIHAARLPAAERQAVEGDVDDLISLSFHAALQDPLPTLQSTIINSQ